MVDSLTNCGDFLNIDSWTTEDMGSYGVALSCLIGKQKTVVKVMENYCAQNEIAAVLVSKVAALQISKTLQKIGIASKGRGVACQFGPSAVNNFEGYDNIALGIPIMDPVAREQMFYPAVVMAAGILMLLTS